MLFFKNINVFSHYLSFLVFIKVFQCTGFWFLIVGLLLTLIYAFKKYVENIPYTWIRPIVGTEGAAMNKTDCPALRELTFKWGETDKNETNM